MVLPELALVLGRSGCLRCGPGLLPEVGEVPLLEPQRSILNVSLDQLWFHLTGELAAVPSLVVGVLGQDDRSVLVA